MPAVVHHWVPLSRKLAPQTPGLCAAVGHAPEQGQQHAFRLSRGTGFSGAAQQGLASAAAAQGTAARSKRGLHLQAAIQGFTPACSISLCVLRGVSRPSSGKPLPPSSSTSMCCEGFRHPQNQSTSVCRFDIYVLPEI